MNWKRLTLEIKMVEIFPLKSSLFSWNKRNVNQRMALDDSNRIIVTRECNVGGLSYESFQPKEFQAC